ncbi:MAG: hypothetical protein CVU88_03520, partial [Firmicutes bacterium HGW-Firmicutes-13]
VKQIFLLVMCFSLFAAGPLEAAAVNNDVVPGSAAGGMTVVVRVIKSAVNVESVNPQLKFIFEEAEEERFSQEIKTADASAEQINDDSEDKGEAEKAVSKAGYSKKDIDLLARLVYAEAKGEPYRGKVAVAASVLNRVNNSNYPNTIPGVIYQYSRGYQYCPVRNGQINRTADETSYRAVEEALKGNDPTNGALSFYNPAKSGNYWIRTRTFLARIGNHIFVR